MRKFFIFIFLLTLLTVPQEALYAGTGEVVIVIDTGGFDPPRVTLKKGEEVRLVFIRKTEKTCATRIKIPEMDIDRALPLNKPVKFLIKPERSGEIGFACPMDMLKGTIRVEE